MYIGTCIQNDGDDFFFSEASLARLAALQLVLDAGDAAAVQHVLSRRGVAMYNVQPLHLRGRGDAIVPRRERRAGLTVESAVVALNAMSF